MYEIGEEEVEAVARVIRRKKLFRYGGKEPTECELLEREWAAQFGAAHALAVNSGTSALIVALIGAGIEPGDEVILPGYTFVASAQAILAVGAVPVLAEVDAGLMLDPKDVQAKLTQRTRAIMPVHMLGHVADLEPMLKLANERGVMVIEDACQCVGGSYRGKRAGTWGKTGAYSLNFYKVLSAGEGGMLVTNDKTAWQRGRVQHDTGTAWRDDIGQMQIPLFAGENYRFDELRGAVMRVQLGRLQSILTRLRAARKTLAQRLDGAPGLSFAPVHDPEGVTGAALFLRVENREQALAFHKLAGERGLSTGLPYDSGRHVYTNWEVLLERRGAYHPARDPLHTTEAGRAQRYTKDMLPRTLENLARVVSVGIGLNWSAEEIEKQAEGLRQAAREVQGAPVASK
ncbi:MAG: DegT/DnrJ/EryC1/StrS family aminotransferase [Planctomycetota bacterium]|nr:DegT/DnrJ/EryC1/StrS family aminotransferase [Planctomycetota bacterium]